MEQATLVVDIRKSNMAAIETLDAPMRLAAQPLYVKVREALVGRLISGVWKPGQMLPSEFAIADELGVSQGTVRKALDEMTSQGLLIRKQGRGTFVSEAEDKSILFRFYRLTSNKEEGSDKSFPESKYLSRSLQAANPAEQELFDLKSGAQVWHFERLRIEGGQPILVEQLTLPQNRFPDLDEQADLPNNVYRLYGVQYGIIVARVEEKLRAVSAPAHVSDHLGLEPNAPVLEIDRRAYALDGSIVEWRISLCRSDTMHYRNELK